MLITSIAILSFAALAMYTTHKDYVTKKPEDFIRKYERNAKPCTSIRSWIYFTVLCCVVGLISPVIGFGVLSFCVVGNAVMAYSKCLLSQCKEKINKNQTENTEANDAAVAI